MVHVKPRFGRYEIETFVARGGMGEIYRARLDAPFQLSKIVAIKVLAQRGAETDEARRAFADEARIGLAIDHPNVARVMELADDDNGLYLVMEWVDGQTLSKLQASLETKGHEVPLGIALHVVREICAGLHAAHELVDAQGRGHEIVHRDVSPQNIMVTRQGQVKVIDFGIAKARERFAPRTRDGLLKGKFRYMAPEQALGRDVDRRSDIWAVGAILFELIGGIAPFEELSDVAIVGTHMRGARPVFPTGLHPAIGRILQRAMATNPAERYATADAMDRALRDCIDELDLRVDARMVAHCFRRGMATTNTEVVETARDAPLRPATTERGRRVPFGIGAAAIAVCGGVFLVVALASARRGANGGDVRIEPASVALSSTPVAAQPSPASSEARNDARPSQRIDPAAIDPSPRTALTTSPSRPAPTRAAAKSPSRPSLHSTPTQIEPATQPPSDCDPPYTIDAQGHRIYRNECL